MTRSCRPSSPALAPVLLAVLLGGEWGPSPSVRPSVCLSHALTAQMGKVKQDPARLAAWDECLKGRGGGEKGGAWDMQLCFRLCKIGKT